MNRLLFVLIFFSINLSFSNNKIDSALLANYTITVTASSSSDYTLSGTDLNGTVSGDDPALTFNVGDQITFSVNASGHPFYLKTVAGTGTDNQVSGITNNGTESGDVVWTPSEPGTYYYQCSAHGGMVGTITINNSVPSVSTIELDQQIINEAGEISTLTATLSTAHSEDVIIPLTISGTASLEDYSTVFATSGVKTVAGGNSEGSALNQFHSPEFVHVDNNNNTYISDRENQRVVKWAPNATEGIVVAGGNGSGSALNQLSNPAGIYVDSSGNLYVSEYYNHRVTKWVPDATEGIVVAGGNGNGSGLNQLYGPAGIDIDSSGNLYIADSDNHRIVKWVPDAVEGIVVAGGNTNGGE